jgi:hypothetical protein
MGAFLPDPFKGSRPRIFEEALDLRSKHISMFILILEFEIRP